MLPKIQSAYRSHHSTETAVATVLSDILLAVDEGDSMPGVILDLSAAFDTVDHEVLLQRLHITYGVNGVAHDWFRSYLIGRHQLNISESEQASHLYGPHALRLYGVPQGSVLDADLISIVHRWHRSIGRKSWSTSMLTTLKYGSCSPLSTDQLQSSISACIDDVAGWMASYRLQLNASNTDIMWCSSVRRQSQRPTSQVRVCGWRYEVIIMTS